MKKRVVSVIVLLAVVLCVGCTSGKTTQNTDNTTETNNQVEVSDDKVESAPDVTVSPTEVPEAMVEPVEEPVEESVEESDFAMITIKGKEYDLSGGFKEVVGSMVKDGNAVRNPVNGREYDEQGELKGIPDTNTPYILASLFKNTLLGTSARGDWVGSRYQIDDMEGFEVASGIGIASVNDAEENLESMGFLKSKTSVGRQLNNIHDGMTYVRYEAIFVNGKVLDFSEYHDDLDDFKKSETDRGSIRETFNYIGGVGSLLGNDFLRVCKNYSDIEESLKVQRWETRISLDEELLFLFAFEDACEQLATGEIESFSVVSFQIAEEEKKVRMFYQECFLEEWESGTTTVIPQ